MKKLIFILLISAFFSSYAANPIVSPSLWKFDHVVIIVDDLKKASDDFNQLGFTVMPGNKMTNAAYQNALIPLSDGTYIELYAPAKLFLMNELKTLKIQKKLSALTSNLNAMEARLTNHVASGEGLVDFAFYDSKLDLNEVIIALDNKEMQFLGPVPMSRNNANKKTMRWDVAVPESNALPLLISDRTPRALRTGEGKTTLQKNGVTGIARITIAVDDLKKMSDAYQVLLGTPPTPNPAYTPPENVKIAVFRMGSIDIVLAQPTDKTGPLFQYLSTHGSGLYRIGLYTTNKSLVGPLNPDKTHKTEIKLIYVK